MLKPLLLSFSLMCLSVLSNAQYQLNLVVKESGTNEAMPGAVVGVQGSTIGGVSNGQGFVQLFGIPEGAQVIEIHFVGYEDILLPMVFPRKENDTVVVLLVLKHEEEEEVQVISTRSSRGIEDIPTRVEFIAGEELEEKGNMKPGDIRMLLSESTGIQTQQTSATTANASFRIQGLDGRYTQLLKDGFPLYAGAASGLGLLQVAPLDLKQAEVIKGSASTLYGGGAIAGLVNLITKTPEKERELRFVVNGTSALGLDVSGYYAKRNELMGTTVLASVNKSKAYDPAGNDFSAIPRVSRYTINPKLFLYVNKKTEIIIGLNATTEDRMGGDMHYIEGKQDSLHRYFETNDIQRVSSQLTLSYKYAEKTTLTFKNSVSYFSRNLATPGNVFSGKQYASFSELNLASAKAHSEWIGGLNVWTDEFMETRQDTSPSRNYSLNTLSAFAQHNWKANKKVVIESGLRLDYIPVFGPVLLPRISILYKIASHFTTRLGGGMGYKTPTIFTEESERVHYKGVLAINQKQVSLEKSYGGNWDFNYKTTLFHDKVSFSINHLFYYTFLSRPMVLNAQNNQTYVFENSDGHAESKGLETNIKMGYGKFKLFAGYTYTDVSIENAGKRMEALLTARHRVNMVLMYEIEEKLKLGFETYTFSKQQLSDGTVGKSYVLCGFMAEKLWEKFSLFINFENFTDTRQTRFGPIYSGSIINPVFKDIYAPLDGFVVNGGVKVRL